ncbi:hypothetical protein MASR1M50_25310 [Burkholderiales bacterium]
MNKKEFKSRVESVLNRMRDRDPRLKAFTFNAGDETLKSLTERLTLLMHDVDVMYFGSNVNLDMEDEYDAEAMHIVLLSSMGFPLRDTFRQVFGWWFEEGYLEKKRDKAALDNMIAWLQRRLDEPPSDDMLTLHRDLCEVVLPQLAEGWSYAALMRTVPEELDPKAQPIERVCEDAPNSTQSGRVPDAGKPDRDEALPWLHHLLFEKTRRRTRPKRRIPYARFRALALSSLTELDEKPFVRRF